VGEGRTDEPRRTNRLTVQQAAAHLGISEGAVRNRITRGTLRAEREAGRVYVLLPGSVNRDESTDESQLVAVLREQLAAERQAHAEARRIIAGLVERIPAIEAPASPEPSEAPSESTPQPGRVEPQPAVEGAQEGVQRRPFDDSPPTASPSQGGRGFLAPVDRVRWWQYVLWVVLILVAAYFTPALGTRVQSSGLAGIPFVALAALVLAQAWAGSLLFGLWIGLKRRNLTLWRHVLPIGALIGIVTTFGITLYNVRYRNYIWADLWRESEDVLVSGVLIGVPFLLYVSGAFIGNAWQRRRIGRISGLVPEAISPRAGWTPRKQAYLGFGGTILASLIGLFGQYLVAQMTNGG